MVTDDGKAQAQIAVTIPLDSTISPTLELHAQAHDLNAAATSKYLPASKLTPKTLAWLDAAFSTGRVTRADVDFRGPVRAFPFRRREGQFVARGQVDGISFNYQDGWAPAEQVAGVVEFRNQGMKLISGTAMVGNLKVAKISGDFADFKRGNLEVKAQAAGDLGDALKLLQTSPIREALGTLFQSLQGQGSTTMDVSMHLPLKRIADRQILVTTHLADARVTSAALAAPVTSLSGSLTVRQSLPETADLRGHWLGGPLQVSIAPVPAATPKACSDGNRTGRRIATDAAAAPAGHCQHQRRHRVAADDSTGNCERRCDDTAPAAEVHDRIGLAGTGNQGALSRRQERSRSASAPR